MSTEDEPVSLASKIGKSHQDDSLGTSRIFDLGNRSYSNHKVFALFWSLFASASQIREHVSARAGKDGSSLPCLALVAEWLPALLSAFFTHTRKNMATRKVRWYNASHSPPQMPVASAPRRSTLAVTGSQFRRQKKQAANPDERHAGTRRPYTHTFPSPHSAGAGAGVGGNAARIETLGWALDLLVSPEDQRHYFRAFAVFKGFLLSCRNSWSGIC